MRVETGFPKSSSQSNDVAPAIGAQKSLGAGEGVRKRSTGLPGEEACADDDDDEGD